MLINPKPDLEAACIPIAEPVFVLHLPFALWV